jgi:membrane protease YdiL (CAAX protease family)
MSLAMESRHLSPQKLLGRIGLALLFSLIGSLTIIVFSQYRPILSGSFDLLGRIGLMLVLLVAALLVRKSKSWHNFWHLIFGLFIMACAVSLDWWTARFILDYLGGYPNTPAGLALEKLKTAAVVAITIIILTRFAGNSLGSIYVQRGNLKLGLTIGSVAFGIAVVGSIPMSKLMFMGENVSLAKALEWAPWIVIAVLGNATNEELLFRGLFLRKLEPLYGRFLSNCLIALVFTGLHLGVTYTRDQMLFLFIVVPLALAWGYTMQKTDSVWGSILFHAGTDIPIFLAIFSTRF